METRWLTVIEATQPLNIDRSNTDKPSQEGNLPIHNIGRQGPLDARNPVNGSDPAN